jgi:acid stress-induced BolA-like protein IbaG/YrbA
MYAVDVKRMVEAGLEGCRAEVEGGDGRYTVTVVGEAFAGLTPVKKQQLVYGTLNEAIADGRIHAVTIRTFTPEQWGERD